MKQLFPFFRIFLLTIGTTAVMSSALAQEMVLAVNEGVTYQDVGTIRERYKPLLDLLTKELKRPITVKNISRYSEFEKGLSENMYALAFIHPAHVALQAVKKGNYEGLATAKGFTEYRAQVMVSKDSPLHSLQDLRGKKVGVPSLESITTVMFTANLRELNFAQPDKLLTPTRYQEAVPFMIDNGFVDAGITASNAVANAWTSKGGRIIGATKPIPIKQFLASKDLNEAERKKVQALLLGLSDTENGKAALAKIGMTGFLPWDTAVMDDATARLGL